MRFLDPHAVLRDIGAYGTQHIVDLGSGAGHVALAAARRLDGGRLYAIDLDRGMLERLAAEAARAGLSNLHALEGDIARLGGVPLAAGIADRVIAANVLWAARDRDALAREALRLLKPGGSALVVEWRGDVPGGPHPNHKLRPEEAIAIFERNGFRRDRDVDVGDIQYGMLFVRDQ